MTRGSVWYRCDPNDMSNGLSFLNRCQFGLSTTSVTWDFGNAVCETPAQVTPTPVRLSVSNNAAFFTSNRLSFEYNPPLVVSGITPLVGEVSGGTIVTVEGANFINTSLLSCRFGGLSPMRVATFINSTHLTCLSLMVSSTGMVSLSTVFLAVYRTEYSNAFVYQCVCLSIHRFYRVD